VAAAVQQLTAQGAEEFVLDLRDNLGGLVEEGVEVARLFLDGKRPPPPPTTTITAQYIVLQQERDDQSTVYTPLSGVPRFPISRSANSDSPLQRRDLYGKQ